MLSWQFFVVSAHYPARCVPSWFVVLSTAELTLVLLGNVLMGWPIGGSLCIVAGYL